MDESKLGYYIPELVDAREKSLAKRIAGLEVLLLALRNEHKDCCCSKCEDITARMDEALLGKGRPVPRHGSGP